MPAHSRPSSAGGAPGSRSRAWVIAAIAVAVAVVALIAVVTTRGGDDDEAGTAPSSSVADQGRVEASQGDEGETGPAAPAAAIAENRTVAVVGQPLSRLDPRQEDPAVGTQAPVLEGFSFDGTPVEVGSQDGEPVLAVVLAHWCPHCNAEVPRLVDWYTSGRVPEDLRVIGVSTAVRADAPNYPPSEWVVDKGWPWEVMADSEDQIGAQALGVSGYPFMVVIGGDGSVLARHSGELGSADEIDAFVRDALGT